MSDPVAVRAEGRRLLERATEGPWQPTHRGQFTTPVDIDVDEANWGGEGLRTYWLRPLDDEGAWRHADAEVICWLRNHADVLLAEPAPGLSEDEQHQVEAARRLRERGRPLIGFADDLLAIIDRLSAAPEPAAEAKIEGEAPTRKDGDDEATSEEPPPRAPRAEREALERAWWRADTAAEYAGIRGPMNAGRNSAEVLELIATELAAALADTPTPHEGEGERMSNLACPHGDPFCPCQDGDSCHYEDTPTVKAERCTTPDCPACAAARKGDRP